MQRRQFITHLASASAAPDLLPHASAASGQSAEAASIEGHTLICEFQLDFETWKVYEDFRTRDGSITYVSSRGNSRVLKKSAEPTFAEANPPYLGLKLSDIGMMARDLLADKLLEHGGDPDPERVRMAAPPLGSAMPSPGRFPVRLSWNTFVGTRECFDTMPVYPAGNTRTYHPVQYFPELTQELAHKRLEGLVGGWMPAVRKLMPLSATEYLELLIFGDVEARDKFIVQTWHRTARIENGKLLEEFGSWLASIYGVNGLAIRDDFVEVQPSRDQILTAVAKQTTLKRRLGADEELRTFWCQ